MVGFGWHEAHVAMAAVGRYASGMANARDILTEALSLPEDEREELAWTLLDSVSAPRDEGVASAWAEEIRRRLNDYRAGRSKGRPWSEVEASLRVALARR
jgi:putative addiction module component (TIGR02574 family)